MGAAGSGIGGARLGAHKTCCFAFVKFESGSLQRRVCLSLEFACRAREAGLFAPVCGAGQRRGRQRPAWPGDMAPLAANISAGPNSSTAPSRLNAKLRVLAPRRLAIAVGSSEPGSAQLKP